MQSQSLSFSFTENPVVGDKNAFKSSQTQVPKKIASGMFFPKPVFPLNGRRLQGISTQKQPSEAMEVDFENELFGEISEKPKPEPRRTSSGILNTNGYVKPQKSVIQAGAVQVTDTKSDAGGESAMQMDSHQALTSSQGPGHPRIQLGSSLMQPRSDSKLPFASIMGTELPMIVCSEVSSFNSTNKSANRGKSLVSIKELKRGNDGSMVSHPAPKILKCEPSGFGSLMTERSTPKNGSSIFSSFHDPYLTEILVPYEMTRRYFCLKRSRRRDVPQIVPFLFDTPEPVVYSTERERRISDPTAELSESLECVSLSTSSQDVETTQTSSLPGNQQRQQKTKGKKKMGLRGIRRLENNVDEAARVQRTSVESTDRSQLLKAYEKREKDSSNKRSFTVAVMGSVHSGKSTLLGHILYLLGMVSDKELQKNRWDASKLKRESSAFAWILDQTTEERVRGFTLDVGQTAVETASKKVILLDCPGHHDYTPQVMTTLVSADAALLLVDPSLEELETGLAQGGRTRELALLARSMGVAQLVIVVSKMDSIEWSRERYTQLVERLEVFLTRTAAFPSDAITFCPVSGLSGVNLVSTSGVEKVPDWYTGPALMECLDTLPCPSRLVDLPLRFTVSDFSKPVGSGSVALTGHVMTGGVTAGVNTCTGRVVCWPGGQMAQVKAIRVISGNVDDSADVAGHVGVSHAFSGDRVSLVLSGLEAPLLSQSSMLCDPGQPLQCTNHIRARLLIFNVVEPIIKGSQMELHYQCQNLAASIGDIASVTLKNGKVEETQQNVRCILKNCTAEVDLFLSESTCLEVYDNSRSLGRFTLRQRGQTIAGGTITQILPVRTTPDVCSLN